MRRRFLIYPKEKLDYLYIEALEDDLTVMFTNDIEYSLNNSTWTSLTANVQTPTISSGSKIYFKGNLTPAIYEGIGTFTIDKNCNIGGNIMSLLFGGDYKNKVDLTGYDCAFFRLFNECTTIKSAENLILPATTLAEYCYYNMFYGCTGLTTAPELPATTLADYCYENMFDHCISLIKVPELPATTLKVGCYLSMFESCDSLVTAMTELPAEILTDNCYYDMFNNCEELTSTPIIRGITAGKNSCRNMFSGCTSLTSTQEELYIETVNSYSCANMFYDCTSLENAPYLPALTLASNCYASMFYGCTNLVDIPQILPATTLALNCYYCMFRDCVNITTAPELPATELVTACYAGIFAGCNALNYVKALFLTLPGSSYTNNWLLNVSSTGTFVKNSEATWVLEGTGAAGIPSGWTIETI